MVVEWQVLTSLELGSLLFVGKKLSRRQPPHPGEAGDADSSELQERLLSCHC